MITVSQEDIRRAKSCRHIHNHSIGGFELFAEPMYGDHSKWRVGKRNIKTGKETLLADVGSKQWAIAKVRGYIKQYKGDE